MKHRGEIIEKVIRERGYPIARVAKKLGKSRRHIYNIFENDSVPFDVIIELGKIINYDFSQDFKELKHYEVSNLISDGKPEYFTSEAEELGYYKREFDIITMKYIRLLERYSELLNEKLAPKKK